MLILQLSAVEEEEEEEEDENIIDRDDLSHVQWECERMEVIGNKMAFKSS